MWFALADEGADTFLRVLKEKVLDHDTGGQRICFGEGQFSLPIESLLPKFQDSLRFGGDLSRQLVGFLGEPI
jgi:hypothetical protein